MRKILYLFIAVLFVACSNDDEPTTPEISKNVQELWSVLNGSYKGTFYLMNTDKVWYTETIKFTPYSEPKQIYPPYTYDIGDIYAFGIAEIEDTRFTDISGNSTCYYVIQDTYNKMTITFYEFNPDSGNIVGDEDKRSIANWSSAKFDMWGYGLTESENSITYNKQ